MPRKKPFSGAKKKKQLQERRARKREEEDETTPKETKQENQTATDAIKNANGRPRCENTGRGLRTVFHKETKEEIEQRKLLAMQPLNRKGKKFEKRSYFGECLDIPTRPPWDYTLTKEELEKNEEQYFEKYLDQIYEKYPNERLNYFEHNLNVWRQLWRVCETSDILCVLADCRNPLFHFPPSLYRYIVHVMKKPLILVLTKADLVPPSQVESWLNYFQQKFPSLRVLSVNSFSRFKVDLTTGKRKRQKVKLLNRYNGRWDDLIKVMNELIVPLGGQPLDVPNPIEQAEEEEEEEEELPPKPSDKENEGEESSSDDRDELVKDDKDIVLEEDDYTPHIQQKKRPYVTLGFVGSPNVGKSTLINALKGKKMCSESRTPGHTKHRQTLYLNPTVVLADCPGLVYPAVDIPKQLQVVCGIFPIAQIREPYSSIQYIAEHIPLEQVYALKNEEDEPWSAYSICDAYAEKRGYLTKAGRTNPYRAGLEILHDVIDGKIEWFFDPDNSRINLNLYSKQDNVEITTDDLAKKDQSGSTTEEEDNTPTPVAIQAPARGPRGITKPSRPGKKPVKKKVVESSEESSEGSDASHSTEQLRTNNPFSALM